MIAKVEIQKSFDEGNEFTKEWENGDFEEFFQEEGEYLDRLSRTAEAHGKTGEGFTITYIVSITK